MPRCGHIKSPEDGTLYLHSAFAGYFVCVGVIPEVLGGAGEAPVAVQQRRCLGERPPAVVVERRVESQFHSDHLAPIVGCSFTRPRARHHERSASGHARAQGFVHGHIGSVRASEVAAGDEQQLGIGRVAEPFG